MLFLKVMPSGALGSVRDEEAEGLRINLTIIALDSLYYIFCNLSKQWTNCKFLKSSVGVNIIFEVLDDVVLTPLAALGSASNNTLMGKRFFEYLKILG